MLGEGRRNRRWRSQFTTGFLLCFVCILALGLFVHDRWFAKTYTERAIEVEMTAEDNGVKIIHATVSYYGHVSPPRFDNEGNVNLHYCRPYVDLTDPSLRADEIARLLPYIRDLFPDKEKIRVAVFLSSERFADTHFVKRLRDELPRCEIFDRAIAPGFFRTSGPHPAGSY